jgi:hypothetical protein
VYTRLLALGRNARIGAGTIERVAERLEGRARRSSSPRQGRRGARPNAPKPRTVGEGRRRSDDDDDSSDELDEDE